MSTASQFFGGGGVDIGLYSATSFCKPSIILFDTYPGTRNFIVPKGIKRIRAFVVGGGGNGRNTGGGMGGGYSEKEFIVSGGQVMSYTVGAAQGTSSFDSQISATGGTYSVAGIGSGGTVNSNGGSSGEGKGGGSSGNRYGNGLTAAYQEGAGWMGTAISPWGADSGGIDGFGIGMMPTVGGRLVGYQSSYTSEMGFSPAYGCGGLPGFGGGIGGGGGYEGYGSTLQGGRGGIGGGGGGSSATPGPGGRGLVGIEVLEVE